MKLLAVLLVLMVGGVGWWYAATRSPQQVEDRGTEAQQASVVLPIDEYASRRTFNGFGEFSQAVGFSGYHTGEDIEYVDVEEKVEVLAIGEGTVIRKGTASGYGGIIVIAHETGARRINAIYGHVDIASSPFGLGDRVSGGDFVAYLGEHRSEETDGERKHLHFALYEGEEMRIQGYESSASSLAAWINPHDFFQEHGHDLSSNERVFDPKQDLGGGTYPLEFLIPEGWEVEYVKEKDALNLYTLAGSGTAHERSRVFITHFDASSFLTLPSVTVHDVQDTAVGRSGYEARRYDIEKKRSVPPFTGQPSWRNLRHVATDFRKEEGFTRYYSFAVNPEAEESEYLRILQSITIVDR